MFNFNLMCQTNRTVFQNCELGDTLSDINDNTVYVKKGNNHRNVCIPIEDCSFTQCR